MWNIIFITGSIPAGQTPAFRSLGVKFWGISTHRDVMLHQRRKSLIWLLRVKFYPQWCRAGVWDRKTVNFMKFGNKTTQLLLSGACISKFHKILQSILGFFTPEETNPDEIWYIGIALRHQTWLWLIMGGGCRSAGASKVQNLVKVVISPCKSDSKSDGLQCFDAVGWVPGRASGL